MNKKRPFRQRWRGSVPPTEPEIRRGREGFEPRTRERVESLAAQTGLFPLFVGPRTEGANTVPRCYLFFSEDNFQRGNENLACIDGSPTTTRLILRPFGRGRNRVTLLPDRWQPRFQPSDLPDWQQLILDDPDDWSTAVAVMRDIRAGYEAEFDVS